MKKEITVPQLRPDMESAILCAWLKSPGEDYKKGEPLYEIETEKVVSQVEAETDGTMGRQLADEGDEVAVGKAIAEVDV